MASRVVVLFDVANVLVATPHDQAVFPAAGDASPVTYGQLSQLPQYRQMRTGQLSAIQFAHHAINVFALPMTASSFMTSWTRWWPTLHLGASAMLNSLPRDVNVGVWAGADPMQWRHLRDTLRLRQWVTHEFVSCRVGAEPCDQDAVDLVDRVLAGRYDTVRYVTADPVAADLATGVGWMVQVAEGIPSCRAALVQMQVAGPYTAPLPAAR